MNTIPEYNIEIVSSTTLDFSIIVKQPSVGGEVKGEWCRTVSYVPRDLVSFLGQTYIALVVTQADEPLTSPVEWMEVPPEDVSAWVITGGIKRTTDDAALTFPFTITFPTGGADGVVTVQLTAAQTLSLDGCYVYDIFADTGSGTRLLLRGSVTVLDSVN